jgi:uncharacterized protein (TIGR02118 family)
MIKLTIVWNLPLGMSAEEFDRRYFNEHVPLASSVPGVRRYLTTKFTSAGDGSPAAFYRMAELFYDDRAALDTAVKSPQSRAARQQVTDWQWRDVSFMLGEETQQELGPAQA